MRYSFDSRIMNEEVFQIFSKVISQNIEESTAIEFGQSSQNGEFEKFIAPIQF